ncbi:hypothetical protein [Legionella sainthelensi]|uniref:hypothetical protein n=1 Tax=Legionella sainthelensi TaxID=28087 RepID=UPI000E202F0C|nr:hypothetical protein [Legionella sainthelensi]
MSKSSDTNSEYNVLYHERPSVGIDDICMEIQFTLLNAIKLDQYIKKIASETQLKELGYEDQKEVFVSEIRKMHLQTAKLINETWELGIDIESYFNCELITVVQALSQKLKKENPDDMDSLRSIRDILSNQNLQIKSIFKEVQHEISQKKKAEYIHTITTPFKNLWGFIRDHIIAVYVSTTKAKADNFQDIKQSTHLSFVHRSVKNSLDALDKKNPKPKHQKDKEILQETIHHEISQYIKSLDEEKMSESQKDYAFATLKRAHDDKVVEPHSGRTIMETLTTIWIAAKDPKAYGTDNLEEDQKTRQFHIIKSMARVQREYNMDINDVDNGEKESRPACRGGTVNAIVESLDMIHPNVKIIRGIEMLHAIVIETFHAEFTKLTSEQQILLFRGAEEKLTESESMQQEILIKDLYKKLTDKLNEINTEIFDGSITQKVMDGYIANFKYLSIPITEAVKSYKAQKEITTASLVPQENSQENSKSVGGYEIKDNDIKNFNQKFQKLRTFEIFKDFSDDQIAKRVVKEIFDEELWDKENNLEQLAQDLLEQNRSLPQENSQVNSKSVGGYEIKDNDMKNFNQKFQELRTLVIFKGFSDDQIAKRVVKEIFDEELWDKDNNLEQLAQVLLEQNRSLPQENSQVNSKPVTENELNTTQTEIKSADGKLQLENKPTSHEDKKEEEEEEGVHVEDKPKLPNKVKVRINIIRIPTNEREENILAVYTVLNNTDLIRNQDGSTPNIMKEIRDIVGNLDPSKEEDIAQAIIEIKNKIIHSEGSNYTKNALDIINAFSKPSCCDFQKIRAELTANHTMSEIMNPIKWDYEKRHY